MKYSGFSTQASAATRLDCGIPFTGDGRNGKLTALLTRLAKRDLRMPEFIGYRHESFASHQLRERISLVSEPILSIEACSTK